MINNTSLDMAEFLGWHIGDGCISITNKYSEYTLTGDITEEYPFYSKIVLPTFNRLFNAYLKKPVEIKKYKSVGVCGIYLFDKKFVSFLQTKFNLKSGKKINVQIPEILKTKDQKICFLRGLFDTDGSIYFCKSYVKTKNESLRTIFHYKPKIKLATISKRLVTQIYNLLSELGFSPMLHTPSKQRVNENIMYRVVLDPKADTRRWIEEISFRNLKHLTKVQIWKKFGFVPSFTTLKERIKILKGELDPRTFYPNHKHLPLSQIKEKIT